MEDVLVARLSNAIKSCIHTVPNGAHVLSMPDFSIEVPGLAVSGLHVMIMEAKDGVRNAIFRFKDFLGALNHAFREDIGFQAVGANHSEKLAINVLAEICLPILNLCRSFESFNLGIDNRQTTEIAARAREFEFQTELLKRFIFNAGIGHADAQHAHLHSEIAFEQRHLS
ncbi:MAG: hypothetical protein ABJ249_06315 [Lentilitoribacter sp.]